MDRYKEESYERYLAGDDKAFEELISAHRDGLMLYINTVVGNISEAEELTEEVFFRIAIRKAKFSGKSSFRTWLYTVGRNLAVDALRKKSKLSDITADELISLSDRTQLEQDYIREEQRIMVHKALDKLNPDYRQVLYLTFIEGMTNPEAGAVMKKTTRQIENLVYRAKGSLKKELEKEGFNYEDL